MKEETRIKKEELKNRFPNPTEYWKTLETSYINV